MKSLVRLDVIFCSFSFVLAGLPSESQAQDSPFPYEYARLSEPVDQIKVRDIKTPMSELVANQRLVHLAIDSIDKGKLLELATAADSYYAPIGNLGLFGDRWLVPRFHLDFRKAVGLGPAALPELMKQLLNQDVTEIEIRAADIDASHDLQICEKLFVVNSANVNEFAFFAKKLWLDNPAGLSSTVAKQYRVRKCDLALILVGQIVNRPYILLHGDKGSGPCFVLGVSKPRGKNLADAMIHFWGGDTRKKLFDSLVVDFFTRPVYENRTRVGPSLPQEVLVPDVMELQVGALARLIRYYPIESEGLIVKRINGIVDPQADEDLDEKNGVYVADFLHTCINSESKAISSSLFDLKERSKDTMILKSLDSLAEK